MNTPRLFEVENLPPYQVLADRSRIMKFDCKAFVDEQLACSSEITVVAT